MKRIKLDLKIGFESLDIAAKDEVTTQHLGKYKSIFKGRGLEFDSYRKYSPDDDASLIDQLASARAGELMVRQYVEERNLDVFFLIDVSNTMILTSQPKLKCEYAAELVSALAYTIIKSDDNIGFGFFNSRLLDFVPPKKGFQSHSLLLDNLTKVNTYGGDFNLKSAVESLLGLLNKGTLLIIVSDFIGLKPGWEEIIRLASSKFSLIGIMVRDPIDRSIPAGMGQIAIADPLSNQSLLIDPNVIKSYYEEEVKREEDRILSIFTETGADFLVLQTDEPFVEKIIGLFRMRQAKWR